jgi:hypothetical protein
VHFLEVSHSSGRGFLAAFRRGAHCSAGNWVLQLRGPAFEDMAVVEKAVEHSGDRRAVAEQFSPVLNGAVGGDQRARAFGVKLRTLVLKH